MTTTFMDLGLSEDMLKAVQKLKYENPTPVQEQAIPVALEGRDIIAGAQTGTGKTAAFCLPCMDNLPHCDKGCGPYMLVVTPTRELADQICEVCDKIAKVTKHKVAKFVGGVSYNPQRDALRRGIDVLIATPGRLEDLINQGAAHLDQVKVLVLDEADRMVDMGFLPSIKNIVGQIEGEHQTLLFSATIDRNVKRVSRNLMRDPVQIEIARRGETAENVDQYVIRINHRAKQEALEAILQDRGANRVIVFARTKHRVDTCARNLKKAGFKVETIHSDRSQAQRRKALQFFDKGSANILVATDVLARGIDVSNVDYVVNFDMPMMAEDYIHRIGRTGRAGEKGFAVSLVSPETESMLKDIQRLIKMDIPELQIEGFNRKEAEAHAKERSSKNAKGSSVDAKEDKRCKDRGDERKKDHHKGDDERGSKKERNKKREDNRKPKGNKRRYDDATAQEAQELNEHPIKGKKKGKGKDKDKRPSSFEKFYKGKKGKRERLEQDFTDERNNYDDEPEFKSRSHKSGYNKKAKGSGTYKGKSGKRGEASNSKDYKKSKGTRGKGGSEQRNFDRNSKKDKSYNAKKGGDKSGYKKDSRQGSSYGKKGGYAGKGKGKSASNGKRGNFKPGRYSSTRG